MEPRLILIHLLIKLGVAAAVSSSLVRSTDPTTSPSVRLADHVFYHGRGAARRADGAVAKLSASDFQRRKPGQSLGGGSDLRCIGDCDRYRAEDFQQRSYTDQAGRTRTAVAPRAHGGTAEPGQSAFSVQHAEFDFVAGALRSGQGARGDLQTGYDFAPPPEFERGLCAAARGVRVHRQLSGH